MKPKLKNKIKQKKKLQEAEAGELAGLARLGYIETRPLSQK